MSISRRGIFGYAAAAIGALCGGKFAFAGGVISVDGGGLDDLCAVKVLEQGPFKGWAIVGEAAPESIITLKQAAKLGVPCAMEAAKLRDALERIALLDEADGHELTWKHASQAVAIATSTLGKHPSQILAERDAAGKFKPR